jgi:hypothetical protein
LSFFPVDDRRGAKVCHVAVLQQRLELARRASVYRGTAASGSYSMINPSLDGTAAYTDPTVVSGQTYYYVATALNSAGQESAYSAPVQAVVPRRAGQPSRRGTTDSWGLCRSCRVTAAGRHASLVDCGIDVSGAAIALIIIFKARRLFKRASSD